MTFTAFVRRLAPTVILALVLGVALTFSGRAHAQQNTVTASPVTITTQFALVPISTTGGSAAQVTLTIPAPPPTFYNYVCSLHLNYSQTNSTGTALTNATTSSTNFGGFAWKASAPAAVNTNLDVIENWGVANTGCAKSTSPGTATTFVSPAAATNGQFTWSATYYQAQ